MAQVLSKTTGTATCPAGTARALALSIPGWVAMSVAPLAEYIEADHGFLSMDFLGLSAKSGA